LRRRTAQLDPQLAIWITVDHLVREAQPQRGFADARLAGDGEDHW
jgi:hypothetical protein